MFKASVLLTLFGLLTITLPASTTFAQTPDAAIKALTDDLEKQVFVLSKSVQVSHYVTRKGIKVSETLPLDLNDVKIKSHLSDWANWYMDPNQGVVHWNRQGLNVAIDPISSREWGMTPVGIDGVNEEGFILFQFELPKGLRILNLQITDQDSMNFFTPLPVEIQSLLRQSSCEAETYDQLFRFPKQIACINIILPVLKALDVDAFAYGFPSTGFEGCETRTQAAFDVLRTANINQKTVHIYSSDIPKSNDGLTRERSIIQELFKIQAHNSLRSDESPVEFGYKRLFSSSVGLESVSREEARSWAQQNLINCGPADTVPIRAGKTH